MLPADNRRLGRKKLIVRRNLHIWLPGYLTRRIPRTRRQPIHVFFCLCDHFEPLYGRPSLDVARGRVRAWLENYPRMASRYRDADGRPPQHTFFFPAEEYQPIFLQPLEQLAAQGFGEVEIHLHHDNDTAGRLRQTLEEFKQQLAGHGFLSDGRYGFIHGNWALDNSRADGRWCGVNNELQVLRETGCYADFTMPSLPHETQPRKVNSIYYATDDPVRPKSYDTGVDVRVGGQPTGDLLMIQGPVALNWRQRKWGVFPRIENADVAGGTLPTPARIDLWVRQRISVVGKPDWVFVKVHTHGCQERNFTTGFGEWANRMHTYLQQRYNDGTRYQLHYVTARELYNLVKAAEAGHDGPPRDYRDFLLAPPLARSARCP